MPSSIRSIWFNGLESSRRLLARPYFDAPCRTATRVPFSRACRGPGLERDHVRQIHISVAVEVEDFAAGRAGSRSRRKALNNL